MPISLKTLMRRMNAMDPKDLSIEQRCRYVQHLRDNILKAAHGTDTLHAWMERVQIDEDAFRDEIKTLNRYNKTLSYSDAMKSWLDGRRRDFIGGLKTFKPLNRIESEWRGCDIAGRIALLEELQFLRTQAYRYGAIEFEATKIRPFNQNRLGISLRNGIVGGYIQSRSDDLDRSQLPEIFINEEFLKAPGPQDALLTLVHEQTHLFILQLAIAHHRGLLPAGHPLAADGHLKAESIKYTTYIPGAIPGGYLEGPEEKVTHGEHEAFAREFGVASSFLSSSRPPAHGARPPL